MASIDWNDERTENDATDHFNRLIETVVGSLREPRPEEPLSLFDDALHGTA